MTELGRKLWSKGVAAFCPTTLSTTREDLKATVSRIGEWIVTGDHSQGALPLGIHLEGPFISPKACGSHPPEVLRPATPEELEELWIASRKTLKILTLAPDSQSPGALKAIVSWARKREIVPSLGHTRASEDEARAAFKSGFTNVTHSWNAMNFHHREPGPLAAALGNRGVFVELIIDGIHVAQSLVRWTRRLHPADRLCFVSDCTPACGLPAGRETSFGPLTIQFAEGAGRLLDGRLAGGGFALSDMYRAWLSAEVKATGRTLPALLRESLPSATTAPLESLGFTASKLARRRVRWLLEGSKASIERL
jgi:N-acetylglucosamine-6-phosphate deacetylase